MRLVLKTCERIFVLQNFSRHEMFLVIPRCRKILVTLTPNQIILCNYFEHLLVHLYDLDFFRYLPGIQISTLLNLLQEDLWMFPFHFYSVVSWPEVQNKRNIYTNINNYHNCFFSCIVAMKIAVSVL